MFTFCYFGKPILESLLDSEQYSNLAFWHLF